ncbi:MAG: universal stress protein [Calditrichaceae bacterium]|nr:universal stress protein [Calditrichaceae bacterium]MBN2707450.1 universal stress protein [Calditrichaceae bacterium]RQV94017.1 MAG: universal stress protein [Calditrichota bacterium]
MKFKHIVVPTDFSPTANNAVKQALVLAARYDAKVTVTHARVLYEDDPAALSGKLKELKKNEEEIESELKKRMEESCDKELSVKVNHEIIRGYSAPSAILNYLNTNTPDLVVIGTHGRSGVEHFLLGSVAEKVVRYAPCPVLTVNESSECGRAFPKIIVPVDFSELSIIALKAAAELAEAGSEEIHLFYAVDKDVHPALYSWGMKSVLDIVPDIIQKAEIKMDQAAAQVPGLSKVKLIKRVDAGVPYKEIARYVKEINADLVVIATHGLAGLDRMLLGSTTEKLIRAIKKPILTLKKYNKAL